ncbi:hypothetical protein [Candidatus Leptofilum sp.]|uniref:hypothetical protein n=1 Tax=Candidatus Leptofilum sp. TaxID=3241576 RepID=UPI003B5D04B8
MFRTPIVVFIAVLLKDVQFAPSPKFSLAALNIVPVCFIVAALIRRILVVSRVL